MTNDQYLIFSYFAVAVLATVLGAGAWLYLRRSFDGVVRAVSNKELSLVLKRLFPAGLGLPAFLGFISVSYHGCGKSYEEIVKERSYLIGRNQEQIVSILLWIVMALLFWDVIILLVLKLWRTDSKSSGAPISPTRLP